MWYSMLAWVVIYRRHLQHSTPIPSSLRTLRTLRLCVQLSRPHHARVNGHSCFKYFTRNTYGSPASVANKRLTARLSPLDATLTKNGGHVLQTKHFFSVLAPVRLSLPPVFRTLFQVPYPATSLFATLAKTAGCVPTIPILELDLCARQPIPLSPILFQFPAWWYPVGSLMNRVYLDFNATTPVEPEVLDAMLPYFSAEFANAASIHTPGQRARAAVETAREQVAALIGARPQEIVFTSGGTESDNHAIFGIVSSSFTPSTPSTPSLHITTTAIEHEAVLNACQALEKEGVRVTYLPTDREGQIDLGELRRAIRPETVLITIMHANNELGTVQPLEEIGRITAEADVYFHTDAVQSAGKIPIDVNAFRLDLLSLSGHKIYAPKAIGALYVRAGTRLPQPLYGGHHQRGFRPGTENVAGIVGLGKPPELARKSLSDRARPQPPLRHQFAQGP